MTTDSPRDKPATCTPACSEGHTYEPGCGLHHPGGWTGLLGAAPEILDGRTMEEALGRERAQIHAPWTPAQVAALNAFQKSGRMHPFTCGGEHAPGLPRLVARADGWHCSDPYGEGCDYRQYWAHAFMARPEAWPAPGWIARLSTPDDDRSQITETVRGGRRLAPPIRSDLGTEFVRQADNPDWEGIAAFEAALPASPAPKAPRSREVGAVSTVTVTVHAPNAGDAATWTRSIADLITAEFGTSMRLSITISDATTPGAGSLRERVAAAIDEGFGTFDADETEDAYLIEALTTAVYAAVQPELDQLRKAERAVNLLADSHRRAEQAEDLLRIAHETSNRSEAERALAVQRAEQAEAQLSLIDAMRQNNLDAAGAAIQRAEQAEAALARVRAECHAIGTDVCNAATRILNALDGPAAGGQETGAGQAGAS